MTPVIILGGILGGIFTPTEASAVAAAYAMFIGLFVLKSLEWKDVPKVMTKAAMVSSVCLLYTSPSPRDAHESRMPSSA